MESNSYLCFLQVDIKSLSKAQRKDFVKRGLRDDSEAVRRVLKEKLLPTWLSWFFLLFQKFFFSRMSKSNSLGLLTCLNVCQPELGVGVWHSLRNQQGPPAAPSQGENPESILLPVEQYCSIMIFCSHSYQSASF